MLKRFTKNLSSIVLLLALTWMGMCCSTQTPSKAQLNKQAAQYYDVTQQNEPGQGNKQATRVVTAAQENVLAKVSERPANNPPGCFMTLNFANENLGWMSCLGHLWKTSDGGRNWQEIYFAGNNRLLNFYFVNSHVIWARTIHKMQKSEDGGYTWKDISIPLAGDDVLLDSIQFLKDGRHGWLAVSDFVSCSPEIRSKLGMHSLSSDGQKCLKGHIFYTEDGGETWRQQSFPSNLGRGIGLETTRDDQVWAFHDLRIFYLADGRWRKVDYTKGQCAHENLLETVDFYGKTDEPSAPGEIFFVGSMGWLSFSNGYLAKSKDGGRTWCDLSDLKLLTQNPSLYFRKLYFSDENNGWGLADHIYETTDGGITWKQITTNIGVEDMYFLNPKHGWAIAKEGLFRIGQ
jgi:photosystem II stability/assembly factor-like uncharacterized protein